MFRSWIKSYPREFKIITLSLIVQVAVFTALFLISQSRGLDHTVLVGGDAKSYRLLAENLVEHGIFAHFPSDPPSYESFRTPGYPAFLALIYFLAGDWTIVLFLQGIILSFVPLLLYLLVKNLNKRAAYIAAIIFVFEPTRLFLSNSFMSDPFFVLVFFASILFLFRFVSGGQYKFLAASSIFLGFASLTRPIAVFLPVLFLVFIFYAMMKKYGYGAKKTVLASVLLLAGFLLVAFPWMARNKILFDSWQLSSVGSSNFVYYNAVELDNSAQLCCAERHFLRYKTGDSTENIIKSFEEKGLERTSSLAGSKKWNEFSKEFLRENFWGYSWFHLVKTAPFFVTDGLRGIARSLKLISDSPPNFSTSILRGEFGKLFSAFRDGGEELILFFAGFIFWFFVSAFAVFGFLREFFRRSGLNPIYIFLFLLILYFAFLTGPVSNARYRLPVSGFLIFLAAHYIVIYLKDDLRKIRLLY